MTESAGRMKAIRVRLEEWRNQEVTDESSWSIPDLIVADVEYLLLALGERTICEAAKR